MNARLETRFIRTGRVLRDIKGRMVNMSAFTAGEGPEIVRASIREEFLSQMWKKPEGGTMRWAPRKGGGSHPLLRLTQRLFSAWMGGAGGFTVSRPRSFQIGVTLDYAAVQRGGSTGDVSLAPVWRNITPRPHATRNPEMVSALHEGARRFLLGE